MILAVSQSPVKGGSHTKKYGYKLYVGHKKYWYVYQIDDKTNKFNRFKIGALSVPYWKAQVKKMKTFRCVNCLMKWKAQNAETCPNCGAVL